MRCEPAINQRLDELRSSGAEIAITSITLCELYKGASLSSRVEQNLAVVNRFLSAVTLLSQNRLSCVLFGQDFARLREKGMPTQDNDLMIASIAKANRCIVVTRNAKGFRNIPDLVVNSG